MPYARKMYRPRRSYRPRSGVTRKSVQAIVNRTVQKRSETKQKFLNVTIPTTMTSAAPILLEFTDLGQGMTQTSRIGNQIRWSGLFGKVAFRTGTTKTTMVRFVLYIPYDSDNELTTLTPMTLIDEDKFTILHDKTYILNAQGGQGRIMTLRKSFFRGMRKGIQSQFSSPDGDSCERNAIKIAICTDGASADTVSTEYRLRGYFKDY